MTHASLAARHFPTRSANSAQHSRTLGSGVVYGDPANDAFAALFDGFDDFDAMARDAAQAPYEPEPLASSPVALDGRSGGRR